MHSFKNIVLCGVLMSAAMPVMTAHADAIVKLSIAGEAYDGPPTFSVLMGKTVIGKGTLDKAIDTETVGRLFASAKPSSYLQDFSFAVPDRQFKPDAQISIILTNDKYKAEEIGRDRNLFVRSLTINGHEVDAAALTLLVNGKPENIDFQAGFMPVYQTRDAVVAEPPVDGWPLEDVSVAQVQPDQTGLTPLPRPVPVIAVQ